VLVIPDAGEAETEGLQLEVSLNKKLARLYIKNNLGTVAHTYNSSYSRGGGRRSEARLGKSVTLYLKNKLKAKGLVVWSKHEILSSIFNTKGGKKKRKERKKKRNGSQEHYVTYRSGQSGLLENSRQPLFPWYSLQVTLCHMPCLISFLQMSLVLFPSLYR
jgi:hypothetical protein